MERVHWTKRERGGMFGGTTVHEARLEGGFGFVVATVYVGPYIVQALCDKTGGYWITYPDLPSAISAMERLLGCDGGIA